MIEASFFPEKDGVGPSGISRLIVEGKTHLKKKTLIQHWACKQMSRLTRSKHNKVPYIVHAPHPCTLAYPSKGNQKASQENKTKAVYRSGSVTKNRTPSAARCHVKHGKGGEVILFVGVYMSDT